MLRNLIFNDFVKIGNEIWFSASNYNGLYKYDINRKKTEWIAFFPNEMKTKKWLFISVEFWKGKLIFIPYYASAIYIYDIKGACFTVIDIFTETMLKKYRDVNKFECCGIYENKIYLIGCGYPGVIRLNLDTNKATELDLFPKKMLKESNEGFFFGCSAVTEKHYLYFTYCSSNEIIQIDMRTEKINIKKVGNNNNRYRSIFKGVNGYYLVNYDNDNIIYWNEENNSTFEISVIFDKHSRECTLCETERFLWIISLVSNEINRVDKKDYTLKKICYDKNLHIEEFVSSYNDKIIFVDSNSGRWFEIQENGDIVDLQISIRDPRAEEEMLCAFEEDICISVQQPLMENEYVNLKNYFTCLCNDKNLFAYREKI